MKLTDLEKRSTTVRIVMLPSEGGRPVTKGYMGPRSSWDKQGLQQVSRWSGGGLILGTDRAGLDKPVDLLLHGRPQESSADERLEFVWSLGGRTAG